MKPHQIMETALTLTAPRCQLLPNHQNNNQQANKRGTNRKKTKKVEFTSDDVVSSTWGG